MCPGRTLAIWPGHSAKAQGPGTMVFRPTSRGTPELDRPGAGWAPSRAGFLSTTYQLVGAVAKSRTASARSARVKRLVAPSKVTGWSVAARLVLLGPT